MTPIDGLTRVASRFGSSETLDRLVAAISTRGSTVFAKIDHAAGAASVDLKLRATVVVIFGHPKLGTALMQSKQSAGLDLPLKVLVWDDEVGATWLSYNEPRWIAARHQLPADLDGVVGKLEAALRAIVNEAAGQT